MQTDPIPSSEGDKPKRKQPGYDPLADIVRPRHLPQASGLSYTTAWRKLKKGQFPAPIRLSEGAIGWRRADINAWLQKRALG